MQLTLTLGKIANSEEQGRLEQNDRPVYWAPIRLRKRMLISTSHVRRLRPTPNIIVITHVSLARFIKFGTLSSLGGVGVGFR